MSGFVARDVLALLSAAILSAVLVGLVRAYALRQAVLDLPSDRSSHSVPTPRGGGFGVVVALLTVFGSLSLYRVFDWRVVLALLGVVCAALVGWKDDHGGLGVRPRLLAHGISGLLLLPIALLPTPLPSWLGAAALVWWLFWTISAINVVNFMDGIDGIIGLQALVFGIHVLMLGGEGTLSRAFALVLLGSALGFLLWNWAPAKIFLGDVGSGALGAVMVLGGILLMRERSVGLVAAYVPLYPIFLDATVTLIRRARQGERLTAAHRSHLYQQLANGRWGHARVSALYGCVSLVGSVLVWSQWGSQGVTIAGYFVSVAVLGFFLERVGRHGRSGSAGGAQQATP